MHKGYGSHNGATGKERILYSLDGNFKHRNRELYLFYSLKGGYGVGLRFVTPFAPIKLDWAFKTKKVPGDTSRSRVHFVLGFFF
jgi:outer membrane protein assembly factor BamA